MLKRIFLTLVLAATMSGCIHRNRLPKLTLGKPIPAFPVVTTPLPQGADAWVCEFKNGDSFQVCDAAVVGDNGNFIRLAFLPARVESLNGWIRVDQPNGLAVYWHTRMTQ